uniref:F-box domain-containing protein n=1 Tax=Plectus sambesii TaxID=2011161 RepID=A0A914X7N6_9BILA
MGMMPSITMTLKSAISASRSRHCSYSSPCFKNSVAALEVEVAHLQAENGRLRRALGDVCGRISGGRLKGKLPDNFLEQFNQLPDRPLEHVLRFLPARQVVQMRHVSRKFNQLIRKCSKTMPKMKRDGAVVFRRNAGGLTGVWFDNYGKKIKITTTTTVAGDEVAALSELLHFIRIGGTMFFSDGLSAADEVLDQLNKAWLTIRPELVVFSGDLSQTSRDSLKTFFVKIEPSIRWLHFENPRNISGNLLSDDVIGAAGRLDGLMVLPWYWGSELHNINIGDDTLLAMAGADLMPSYIFVMGCSDITPGGIRVFVEKWMKKERPKVYASISSFGWDLELCELTFCKCANVTPAAVEEACGHLLKKDTIPEAVVGFDQGAKINERICYTFECPSSNCRLDILFQFYAFNSRCIKEPRLGDVIYNNYDGYCDSLYPEVGDNDFNDHDGYDAIDNDDV